VPVRPAQIERDPAKMIKMESLKAELRNPASGNPTVYFDSPEDLASRVIRDIEHTLQDGSGRGRGAVAVGADRDEVVAAALMTLRGEGAGADAPAPVRAKAGRALARLGDPRREVTVPEATPFCRVPAGPFWMGSDAGDYECERPRHRADLPYDYYIARYPVTNAQYQAFCDAGGYAVAAYWREATREGYWADGALFNDCGGAIGGYGEPFDLPNHPLAGIPWYGAVAYGRWLGERLAAMGGRIPVWDPARGEMALRQVAGLAVRLPTEREWEKAARGPDGLIYPWGNAPNPERANYDETGIAATSAVGCFPGSASPYGAQGMSGNVWEWCASKWRARYADGEEDNDPWGNDRRVVRGGSFCYEADGVHTAARSWDFPDLGAGYVGFRVVAVGARDDVAS